ncbi:MAG: DUF3137 domain-containing protein [Alphaproteobacteria bacterium]|nr:DUF3137 domain-containing protein [Alphaproteobacteria bacterium]
MSELEHDEEYFELKNRFDAYYNETLLPILARSEGKRRLYLVMFVILLGMGTLFYPAIIVKLWQSDLSNDSGIIGVVLGLSCLVIMLLCGPIYAYKQKVKPQIMPDFANFFGSFYYQYEGKIDDTLLRQSNLFGEYNHSMGDDCFIGTYGGVRVSISEEKLKLIKKDFNNFDIRKNVFEGICILFEMNKNFKGRTVVLKDRKMFNVFNKIKGLQNVKLEDIRFEKYFEVYSDDQIEARYLLTTGLMDRILKLRDLYDGKSIQFSFIHNTLLLAIPTKQNMFEANSFFRSNANKKKVDTVFNQFYTIFSIIKLLKLNQKIGM